MHRDTAAYAAWNVRLALVEALQAYRRVVEQAIARAEAAAEGIVDVTLVATVPEARRRGYGTAVTWKATLADPDLHPLLISTPEGRPAYESMGYLPLFNFTTWSKARPAQDSR